MTGLPPLRLRPDGPPLPAALVEAVARGDAVFLCGAGVSMTEGLPGFRPLVEQVYASLSERLADHPAELRAMEDRAYDRVLFALQLRLAGLSAGRSEEVERRIVAAAHDHLRTPDGPLPHHLDLLRLSRGADGRPRLVTTNFDTLFETAWERAGNDPLPSHAGTGVPPPGSGGFAGVLHLHGRLGDKALRLDRSDLVLTSAQFGDAYLRSGWASRLIYDLARAHVLVIVGYSADDPPVRYILDVLAADRNRFRDLKAVFAFAAAPTPEQRIDVESEWIARGTTPIVYDAPGQDHSALYTTLEAWASRADDAAGWRRERALAILARPPDEIDGEGDGQLHWALAEQDATAILTEANPDPAWLGPLVSRQLDGRLDVLLPWIQARLTEPPMLDAAIQNFRCDDELEWRLDDALSRADLPEAMRKVWRLVLRQRPSHRPLDNWHFHLRRVARGEVGHDVQRRIAGLLRPRLRALEGRGGPAPDAIARVGDYAYVRTDGGDRVDVEGLMTSWPEAEDEPLLRVLLAELHDALHEAAHLDLIVAGSDRTTLDVGSVSKHSQDEISRGFYHLVRAIADLADRLAPCRPVAVRSRFDPLAASPFLLERRLHLHAASLAPVVAGPEVGDLILSLDDEAFWRGGLRRELMRLLVTRWEDLSVEHRDRIEARLVAGPPAGFLHREGDPEDRVEAVQAWQVFQRLSRIEGLAEGLGEGGRAALARIRTRYPDWQPEGERADFLMWSWSTAGEQGDPNRLRTVAVERRAAEARRIAAEEGWAQEGIWPNYVDADPAGAFEALVVAGEEADAEQWRRLVWALPAAQDEALSPRVIDHLVTLSPEALEPLRPAVAAWLERSFDVLVEATGDEAARLLRLWDLLAARLDSAMSNEPVPLDDPLMAVLNRSPGQLARVLLRVIVRRGVAAGARLPADLAPRLESLLALTGAAGFTVLAALIDQLPLLHDLDPAWTEARLLSRLDWDDEWATGLWLAYLRSGRLGSDALFAQVQPLMVEAFARRDLPLELIERLVEAMVAVLLSPPPDDAWPRVNPLDVKRAIALSPEAVRGRAAHGFWAALRRAPDPAARWGAVVGPAFRAAWPMEAALRSAETTQYLSWMATAAGEAFPDAVAAIQPALLPAARAHGSMGDFLSDERADLARRHPAAALVLLDALTVAADPPADLATRLDEIAATDPALRRDPRFERLWAIARRG